MNAIVEAILDRRSHRFGFSNRPIADEVLESIARCGLAAPSSKNAQPWRLHIITDKTLLAELADSVEHASGAGAYVPHDPKTGEPRARYTSTVSESAEVLRQVSAGLFIENTGPFSDGRRTLASVGAENLALALAGYMFEIIGIGAAIENMWLAANGLGIRVAFMGDVVIAEHDIRERLGLSGDLIGVLALGYSDAPLTNRRQSLDVSENDRIVWH